MFDADLPLEVQRLENGAVLHFALICGPG